MSRVERGVTIAPDGDAPVLDGIYLPGEPEASGAIVAPPHPLMGGSMHHAVVSEAAYALRDAGLAVLRFDWRGTGGSAGTPSGELDAGLADYTSAAAFMEESVEGPLVAAGYSFGAGIAVRASQRHRRIQRLLLISPPLMMLDAEALEAFPGAVLIVTAEHDEFAPPAELETLAARLERGRFHLVPEADHFYQLGLAEIARAIGSWS